MKCQLCGNDTIKVIYSGHIRNGGLGIYTNNKVNMYQCEHCGVIWHDKLISDTSQYYESPEYRNSLEGSSDIEKFYELHDKETLDKLQYTGTTIFRHKTVADIGCGGGAFLDFLVGAAKTIIAVEPSETYRKHLEIKGYKTYDYMENAQKDWENKIDVITSFDVIEHVENPTEFIKAVYCLLIENGQAIIGTPTDAPIMRRLLGEIYEKQQLFSTQHLWIFSKRSLTLLAEKAGFRKIELRYFQRYGIENLLGWLKEKESRSDISDPFFSDDMDAVWRNASSRSGLSDYLVLYAYK